MRRAENQNSRPWFIRSFLTTRAFQGGGERGRERETAKQGTIRTR